MDTKILIKNCCLFNLLQRGIKNQIVNVVRTYGSISRNFEDLITVFGFMFS